MSSALPQILRIGSSRIDLREIGRGGSVRQIPGQEEAGPAAAATGPLGPLVIAFTCEGQFICILLGVLSLAHENKYWVICELF